LRGLKRFYNFTNARVPLYRSGFDVDGKVQIRCPACTQVFREKASRVRDGVQLNCPNCCKLLTLSKETEDPYFRRALTTARQMRAAKEAQYVAGTYARSASAPKRERA
jgi:uncharacterized C2H2 Zn-finger protein